MKYEGIAQRILGYDRLIESFDTVLKECVESFRNKAPINPCLSSLTLMGYLKDMKSLNVVEVTKNKENRGWDLKISVYGNRPRDNGLVTLLVPGGFVENPDVFMKEELEDYQKELARQRDRIEEAEANLARDMKRKNSLK